MAFETSARLASSVISAFPRWGGAFKETILSIAIILSLAILWRVGVMLIKKDDGLGFEAKRSRISTARNAFILASLVSVAVIWGGEIRSVIISVAAIAAAILIVSKEILSCFWGHAVFLATRPASIGDIVEISGVSGELIDVSWFHITVLETARSKYLTGRTLRIPNSVLLTSTVSNHSITGEYRFSTVSFVVPNRLVTARAALLSEIAKGVCLPWTADAETKLELLRGTHLIDAPDAKPKVAIIPLCAENAEILLRFPCPGNRRASVEQEIISSYYGALAKEPPETAQPQPPEAVK